MLDTGNDCLLSNDGVHILLAKKYSKQFYSYKFKWAALAYEIGLCIKTGYICWFNGPFEPGIYNDNEIFKRGLIGWLEDGERVETDEGYKGSAPLYVKCPGTVATGPDKKRNVCERPLQARDSKQAYEAVEHPQGWVPP